jgi:hypothetical protein
VVLPLSCMVTDAVNCWFAVTLSGALIPTTVAPFTGGGGNRVTVAEALLLLSATLVAVT